jgi:hypothetical protein
VLNKLSEFVPFGDAGKFLLLNDFEGFNFGLIAVEQEEMFSLF